MFINIKPIVIEETDLLRGPPFPFFTELPLLPKRALALAKELTAVFPFAPFQYTDDNRREMALNAGRPGDRVSLVDLDDGQIVVDFDAVEVVGIKDKHLILSDKAEASALVLTFVLTDSDGETRGRMYLHDARAWPFADSVLAWLADNFPVQAAVIERRRAAFKELVQRAEAVVEQPARTMAEQSAQIEAQPLVQAVAEQPAKAVVEQLAHVEAEQPAAAADQADMIPAALRDVARMRGYHPDYALETALLIAKALPKAREEWLKDTSAPRWKPASIAPYAGLTKTTVSRYVGAWRKDGIAVVNGVPIPEKYGTPPD